MTKKQFLMAVCAETPYDTIMEDGKTLGEIARELYGGLIIQEKAKQQEREVIIKDLVEILQGNNNEPMSARELAEKFKDDSYSININTVSYILRTNNKIFTRTRREKDGVYIYTLINAE